MLSDARLRPRFGIPVEVLRDALPSVRQWDESPFRGLGRFERGDERIFFGRQRALDELVEELRLIADRAHRREANRVFAVLGPSGSGKSSLIRAGLEARVRDGALGDTSWVSIVVEPTANPLKALKQAGMPGGTLRASVDRWSKANRGQRLLLIFDQFEDLVLSRASTTTDRFRQEFVQGITHLPSDVIVIVVARSDLFERIAELDGLGPVLARNHYVPTDIRDLELREIVVGPVGVASYEAGLPSHIVADCLDLATTYQSRKVPATTLPLLEFALFRLWEARDDGVMTFAAYDQIGGVTGALAKHGDRFIESLKAADPIVARDVLLDLVDAGNSADSLPVSRTVTRRDLTGGATAREEVLDRLIQARLVLPVADREDPSVRLIHDSLAREWPTLHEWITEHLDYVRWRADVAGARRRWLGSDRQPNDLLSGSTLDNAAEFVHRLPEGSDLAIFVHESLDAQSRATARELRRTRVVRAAKWSATIGIVVVAVVFFLLSVQLRQQGTRLAVRGIASAAAQESLEHPRLATALAREAALRYETETDATGAEVTGALFRAMHSLEGVEVWAGTGRIETLEFLGAGPWVSIDYWTPLAATAGGAWLTNIDTGEMWPATPKYTKIVLSQNEAFGVGIPETGAAEVFTFVDGRPVVTSMLPAGTIWNAAISSNGRQVTTETTDEVIRRWAVDQVTAKVVELPMVSVDVALPGIYYWKWLGPEQRWLVIQDSDDIAFYWQGDDGALQLKTSVPMAGVESFEANPISATLAFAMDDGSIRLMALGEDGDIDTGSKAAVHEGKATSVAWIDPVTLVSGGQDGKLQVHHVRSVELETQASMALGLAVSAVAASRDGRWVAAAVSDSRVRLWDRRATEAAVTTLSGQDDVVRRLAFDERGGWLLTASGEGAAADGLVRGYALNDPRPMALGFQWRDHEWRSDATAIDGSKIALAEGLTLRIVDVGDASPVSSEHSLQSTPIDLAFSDSGGWIAVSEVTGLEILDPVTGVRLATFADTPLARIGQGSGSDSFVVAPFLADASIVRRALDGSWSRTTLPMSLDADSMTVSPDGRWVVGLSHSRGGLLWNAELASDPIQLPYWLIKPNALSFAFSPDGRWLAVSGSPGSGSTILGSPGRASTIAYLVDLTSMTSDGKFERKLLVDTDPETAAMAPVSGMVFSPDSRSLVTAHGQSQFLFDPFVRLWDIGDEGPSAALSQQWRLSSLPSSMRFDATGETLAVGGFDGTISLMFTKVKPPSPVVALPLSTVVVDDLAWMPDGAHLAVHLGDGSVALVATSRHELLIRACGNVRRKLSITEREGFLEGAAPLTCP